jgi:hypothetical protein
MQLLVGSRWTDSQGREFVIDAVNSNGEETWVEYCRVGDRTYYRCLAEAFTFRFSRIENDSRT